MKKIAKTKQLLQFVARPMSPVTSDKTGNIVLHLSAKPGAKFSQITSIDENSIDVQISAKPVDGEANSELLKYLSSILNVKKNEISLEKGTKSRQKIVKISCSQLTVDKVLEILKSELK